MIRHRTFSALLTSPPALRSEIVRKALVGRWDGVGGERFLSSAGSHRATPFYNNSSGGVGPLRLGGRRWQSTTTTTGPAPASSTDTPPRSRLTRFLTTTALALGLYIVGFAMSASPAAETINGYVNPPTDEETLRLYDPPTPTAEEINDHIINHPLAKKLRLQDGMVESRPHMRIPPHMRPHNLTGGTLLGEGKIEVPPLNFNEKHAELPTMVQIMYFGPALCGHPGIVHGGLLATILDEGLARACFPALPNKVGVTANLKIDYRVPCPAGRYVVLKAETTKVEGRKVWCKGWIELLGEEDGDGTKVVEAEALFIEPKHMANSMAKNIVASPS